MENSDLYKFTSMLNKSNETFSKEKKGSEWTVKITSRNIEFHFDVNGVFKWCYADRT